LCRYEILGLPLSRIQKNHAYMKQLYSFLTIIFLSVYFTAQAQVLVNPGTGSCLGRYTTTYTGGTQPYSTDWELPGSTDLIDKTQQAPKVVSGFSKPVQTNDWWSSAIWDYYQSQYNRAFTGNLVAPPWTGRAIAGGIQLQYKNLSTVTTTTEDYIMNSATNELSVSLAKGSTNMSVPGGAGQGTNVKDYGDYHVTINWTDATNGMGMDATVTKGSPFVFFDNITASTDVIIRTSCGPMVLGFTSPSGNRRVSVCGRNYGIFFSPGTTIVANPVGGTMWVLNEGHAAGENVPREYLRFTPPAMAGQRYVVLAVLPNSTDATFLEYERRAYAFITGTQVDYTYDPATALVTSTFTTSTALKANAPAAVVPLNETVHALFRHQFINIDPLTPVNTAYQYESPRGNMNVRYGNFNTVMKHYGMLQHLPWYGSYKGADSIALRNLINQKYLQPNLITGTTDLYFWGKRLNELAQLIPIARQMGHMAAYNRFKTELRTFLADLLTTSTGEVNHVFYYDDNWDMLVHYPGSYWSTDEGNDRHFHYGYVIAASAMMARYDATFVTQYGPMVEMLIKDVANWQRQSGGTGTNIFPYLRFFDAYEGHSWANGMATDDENYGNDQESSSEAINCWSAIALWGEATNNTTFRDLGIYLRTTEIAAAEQYWFDVDNAVFPAGYGKNTVGILRGNGGEYRIYFNANARQCIHSINWLPFTGSSFYLGMSQPTGATQLDKYNEMLANQIAPATPGAVYYDPGHFPDLIATFQSLYDPVSAKTMFNNMGVNMDPVSSSCCPYSYEGQNHPFIYFDGQFTAFTDHWILTLDSLRSVQRITSNYPKTHVFNNGCWYYVIDNDNSGPVNVTFSDGRVINNAPGDSVSVYRFCNLPLPVELLSFDVSKQDGQAFLQWITTSEQNSDRFIVERSCDGKNFEDAISLKAKGSSSTEAHYQTYDSDLCSSTTYYRLKEIDLNGAVQYSVVKSLSNNIQPKLSVQPIPATTALTLTIQEVKEKNYTISLMDMMGREILTTKKKISAGIQTIEIDLTALSAATYVLSVYDEQSVKQFFKVVKE